MKTRIFLSLGMVIALLSMISCNDEKIVVSKEIQTAFDAVHPNAKNVRWEMEDVYYVAEFKEDNIHKNAWFTSNAVWLLSESDYRLNNLPQSVQNAFNACEYANWHVDDVDVIIRPNIETIYVIEVNQGETEVDLHFNENGDLIKIEFDTDDDQNNINLVVNLPELITNFITTNYPNAVIIDAEYEFSGYEVDIIYNQEHKELYFTPAGTWTSTVTDISLTQIPQVVLSAVQTSQYSNYHIDDVDFVETPTGNYYLVELELNDQEATLQVPA